ncbi:hypothetical protein F4782DRAFT_538223 [Xylaria castorea]|nr:hypothetical protein F4782DRAFT_538223 [Xylaria castorea]
MGTLTFNEISYCGHKLFIIDIIFITLDIVFLALRFWSARIARRKLFLDDWAVVIAFVMMSVLSGAGYWGIFNGLGKHITTLTPDQLTVQVKLLLICEFTYLLGVAFIKLSMLFLYHRIYTTPTFRRWVYFVIALGVIYISETFYPPKMVRGPLRRQLLTPNDAVVFIPIFLTNCIPLSQYWDPKPTGWCRDTVISDSATVAGNLLLDILVLALPLPVLWRLQMSVRDKITVTAMFSIGIVTVALVLWRLGVTTATRASADWTATLCQVGLIASLELQLGILAVCIPTYGPFFNAYIKPILRKAGVVTSTSGSKTGGKRSYLNTFGSSNPVKRSRGYDEFSDSVDRIVSRDDNSINLAHYGEGKVVSECAFKPPNEPGHGRGEIHVQRDFKAVYHAKKGGHSEA